MKLPSTSDDVFPSLRKPRLDTQMGLRQLPQALEEQRKMVRLIHLHRDLDGSRKELVSSYVKSVVGGSDCPALEQDLVNSGEDHDISRDATIKAFERTAFDRQNLPNSRYEKIVLTGVSVVRPLNANFATRSDCARKDATKGIF